MIVDTSAIVAMAWDESEGETFLRMMEEAHRTAASAPTILEASLVLRDAPGKRFLQTFVDAIDVVPFDTRHLDVARAAHQRYGRGSGHPARLNFGDCFAYALAITTGEPLLFKGDDLALTDVTPAYVPD